MPETAVRRFQARVSWQDLDALAGKIAVGWLVDKSFAGGDTRQNFYEIASCRSQCEVTELRNALAVEEICTGQRTALRHGRTRNEKSLASARRKLRGSIDTGVERCRRRQVDLDHKTAARRIGGGNYLRYRAHRVFRRSAGNRDMDLHPLANRAEYRFIDR